MGRTVYLSTCITKSTKCNKSYGYFSEASIQFTTKHLKMEESSPLYTLYGIEYSGMDADVGEF